MFRDVGGRTAGPHLLPSSSAMMVGSPCRCTVVCQSPWGLRHARTRFCILGRHFLGKALPWTRVLVPTRRCKASQLKLICGTKGLALWIAFENRTPAEPRGRGCGEDSGRLSAYGGAEVVATALASLRREASGRRWAQSRRCRPCQIIGWKSDAFASVILSLTSRAYES